MTRLPSNIAVIGAGVIGGSVMKAIHETLPGVTLRVVETNALTRQQIVSELGDAVSVFADINRQIAASDIVMIATPIKAVASVFQALFAHGCSGLITDVSGIKVEVEDWAARYIPTLRFIGSHPMAGGAGPGLKNSRANLFNTATVAICAPPGANEEDAALLTAFWEALGAVPLVVSAPVHDRAVAYSSHLPYLAAIAHLHIGEQVPQGRELWGPGFLRTTRYADFAPEIMAEVATRNPSVPEALRALASTLTDMATAIEDDPQTLITMATHARTLRPES